MKVAIYTPCIHTRSNLTGDELLVVLPYLGLWIAVIPTHSERSAVSRDDELVDTLGRLHFDCFIHDDQPL